MALHPPAQPMVCTQLRLKCRDNAVECATQWGMAGTHSAWDRQLCMHAVWDHCDVLSDRELQCQRRRWLQCAAAQRERGAHARKARTLVRRSQHGVACAKTRRLPLSQRRFFGSLAGWGNITMAAEARLVTEPMASGRFTHHGGRSEHLFALLSPACSQRSCGSWRSAPAAKGRTSRSRACSLPARA